MNSHTKSTLIEVINALFELSRDDTETLYYRVLTTQG